MTTFRNVRLPDFRTLQELHDFIRHEKDNAHRQVVVYESRGFFVAECKSIQREYGFAEATTEHEARNRVMRGIDDYFADMFADVRQSLC
jgi:hypothetical protein